MKKFKNIGIIGLFSLFVFSCGGGGDDSPSNEAPTTPQLTFPTPNLLCIDNNITFTWDPSTDANNDIITYRFTLATDRNLTNIVETRIAGPTSIFLSLDKGQSYYWSVVAIDDNDAESASSSVNAFYTEAEVISNAAPFTAELVSPNDGGTVDAGSVTLSWNGADADTGDTLTYDLFFGESSDPAASQNGLSSESANVDVESGKTYYWKINTTDNSGAKSIGQVWSFSVN